jgi:hypothetical protein
MSQKPINPKDDLKHVTFDELGTKFPGLFGNKGQPELAKTARKVELVAGAVDGQQGLVPITKAFAPRDFIIFGLPHKPVKGGLYERRSGNTTYQLIGDPRLGLPFGQDRLIGIFLATAFQMLGRPKNNILCFKTPADILRLFHLSRNEEWESWHPGGSALRQLRASLARTIAATYLVHRTEVDPDLGVGQGTARYSLMSEYWLWFSEKDHPNQYSLWTSYIELDKKFAEDLRRHPVPINLDMVRALRTSTGALDLGLWQAWRSHGLAKAGRREARIEVFGRGGLLEQFGSVVKSERKMRQQLKEWHGLVKKAWPTCPNELTADGNTFCVRPAVAVPMEMDKRLKGRIGCWEDSTSPFDLKRLKGTDARKHPEEKPGG